MNRSRTKWRNLLLAFLIIGLGGCVATTGQVPQTSLLQPLAPAGYELKTTQFMILADVSHSMTENAGSSEKGALERAVLTMLNQGVPAGVQQAGLQSFGDPCGTVARFPYGAYQRADLAKVISNLQPTAGNTPLSKGLQAIKATITATSGPLALFIVSDGKSFPETAADSLEAARQAAAEWGQRVCIYPILVGDDAAGKELMTALASLTGCGAWQSAAELLDANRMNAFLTEVFLRQLPAPKPQPKPQPAPPADQDGDGVIDARDACPDTPRGAPVDNHGCWVLKGLRFATDKADIEPAYQLQLSETAAILRQNPSIKVLIQGHTDSQGSEAYNQKLSERRAQAVSDYLQKNGVAAERLTVMGFGESRPIADNQTAAGREANRRVELHIVK